MSEPAPAATAVEIHALPLGLRLVALDAWGNRLEVVPISVPLALALYRKGIPWKTPVDENLTVRWTEPGPQPA